MNKNGWTFGACLTTLALIFSIGPTFASAELPRFPLKKGYARDDLKCPPDELGHRLDLERMAPEKGLGIEERPGPTQVPEAPRPAAALGTEPIFKGFEAGLEKLRRRLRIPGMAAGVVKDGELVWAKGFGYADVENGIKADAGTPWHIASVTKTFTAAIVLQLVEEGRLGLDDPLEKFGIRMKSPGVVRVRHVLTHTSEAEPGTFFRYSGRLWEHLAQVIERTSGRSFKDLLIERIIRRLDLSDTAPNKEMATEDYRFQDIRDRASVFYAVEGASPPKRQDLVLGFYAAGGLFSSVRDIALYNAAIDDGRLLKAETREMMFTPHRSPQGRTLPHGLGWFCQDVRGVRLIWHFGWHPDHASAFIVKAPDKGLSFMVFANSDKLSQPFSLLHGDILNSPAAQLFLKTFVFPGQRVPEITTKEAELEEIVLKAGGWKPVFSPFQRGFLFLCLAVFLTAPIVWAGGKIIGNRRARKAGYARERPSRGPRLGRSFALIFMMLSVLFMAALWRAPFLAYWPELPGWVDGITTFENIVLALPTLLAILSPGMLLFGVVAWIRKAGPLSARLHDTLLASFGLAFVLLLIEWHLVGLSYYWSYWLK